MNTRQFWLLVFSFLFALVTYLTVTPNPDDTKEGMAFTRWLSTLLFGNGVFGDKIAHFLAYGALGFSALLARISLFGERYWTLAALAAYGALLEGVQGAMGVRSPEVVDAISNAAGALSAFPAIILLGLVTQTRRPD